MIINFRPAYFCIISESSQPSRGVSSVTEEEADI